MSQICQIGFDVGGTGLKASLVQAGRILETVTATTPAQAEADESIALMARLILQLLDKAAAQGLQTQAVGMGIAGLIDGPRGVVLTSPNLPAWKEVPLARKLQEQTGLPVCIDNDVRTMAKGEMAYGAGQGAKDLLCLTVGTGVGSAIIIDGQIYRGASLTAGEFGHMMVVPEGGRNCGCGNRGCLETVAGTEGILSLARQYHSKGLSPVLSNRLQSGDALTPKLITEAAEAGDTGARAVWQEVGRWLGLALAGAVNLLNPEKIVIGGGISAAGALLLEPVKQAIRLHAFARPAEAVQVLPAQLGNDAGMIGAAVLAQEMQEEG